MQEIIDDIHKNRLALLTRNGDWAGLARYWLALEHPPALHRAIQLLKEKAETNGDAWRTLANLLSGFAEDPVHRTFPLVDEVTSLCLPEELTTLHILQGYSCMLWTELGAGASPEMRFPMLEVGVVTSLRGANLAAGIGDRGASAACATQLVLGLANQGRHAECLPYAIKVSHLYETLVVETPKLFVRLQARAFINLTMAQVSLELPHEAKATALKAVRCARLAASWSSSSVRADLANAWNNLGFTWGALGRPATAACCARKAVVIEREALRQNQALSPVSLARSLWNASDFARQSYQLDQAKVLATEAVEILRPAGRMVDMQLASALIKLSAVYEFSAELAEAEACCREATKIRERASDACGLGDAHLNLADILYRQERLKEALEAAETALACYRSLPETRGRWRDARIVLAMNRSAIALLKTGDFQSAKKNFDDAISRQRLLADSDLAQAATLASFLSNRSQLHREFSDYEAALRDAEEAARIFTELPLGIQTAQSTSGIIALSNLGGVFSDLTQFEKARQAYVKAIWWHRKLKNLPARIAYPERARLVLSLAEVKRKLAKLASAHRYLAQSLRLLRSPKLRKSRDWAGIANALTNLANVQRDGDDASGASFSYRRALRIYKLLAKNNEHTYRAAIARMHGNLGALWMSKFEHSLSAEHYEIARSLYREAAAKNPDHLLGERMHVLGGFATLLSQHGSPVDPSPAFAAFDVLQEAQEVAASYRGHFIRPEERQRIQHDAQRIFALATINGICLAESVPGCWPLEKAVEAGEAARARHLTDSLALRDAKPLNTPTAVLTEFREARDRLRSSTFRYANAAKDSAAEYELQNALGLLSSHRAEYDRMVNEIRERYDPGFAPDTPATRMRFEEISAIIPTDIPTAFIQFSALVPNTGAALIICKESVHSVLLPDLTEARLHELATLWRNAVPRGEKQDWQNWENKMQDILNQLARCLLWPMLSLLEEAGIRRLVICLHRELHLFPIQACPLPNGRPLIDFNGDCQIITTPSFALLTNRARLGWPSFNHALLIDNPTGDLEFASVEGAVIRELYKPNVREPEGACSLKLETLQLAPDCEIFHYAGHADFDAERPLGACLRFGENESERLTLPEILSALDLQRCSLAVLSGCETSASEPDSTDDQVSLATGFLYAGARCVMASLWQVDDLSTALLMAKFHSKWRGGLVPAAALIEAQDWLRKGISNGKQLQAEIEWLIALFAPQPDLNESSQLQELVKCCREYGAAIAAQYPDRAPFESPAYWAAFVLVGLGFSPEPVAPHRDALAKP